MTLSPPTSKRPTVRVGLLLWLSSSCLFVACDRRAPTEADARPAGVSLSVTIRQVDDSTIAFDLVAADTVKITHILSAIETAGAPMFDLYGGNFTPMYPAAVETTSFSPRYNVSFSDTLASRTVNSYYGWVVLAVDTLGRRYYRSGTYYSGARLLTLSVAGIPDVMNQIGLDLVVQPRGQFRITTMRTFSDSGTVSQQSYQPTPVDSQTLAQRPLNPDLHLWIRGPLSNGSHTFTFVTTDSAGRVASFRKTITVSVPSRQYRLTAITVPGAIDTYANAINSSGTIAGSYRLADSTTLALRWSNGASQNLPGPSSSSGSAINDSGVVAGYVGRRMGTCAIADSVVVWRDTVRTVLASDCERNALHIASDGTVLAASASLFRGASETPLSLYRAEAMNDLGVVVGYIRGDIEPPFLAAALNPQLIRVPTPYGVDVALGPHQTASTFAGYINNAGQIIGSASRAGQPFMADGTTASWLINPLGLGTVAGMSKTNLVLWSSHGRHDCRMDDRRGYDTRVVRRGWLDCRLVERD